MTLRVMSAGRPLLLDEADGALVVATGKGERLDLDAADVLVALGGSPPAWAPTVAGLRAVHQRFGLDPGALERAAEALGRKRADRAALAKTTADAAVLLALAASAHPQAAANPLIDSVAWDALMAEADDAGRHRAWGYAVSLPVSMADHPDPMVRVRVAANPACPPDVLDRLAAEAAREGGPPGERIRAVVAVNPSTASDTLRRLARSQADEVARAAARNPRTPARTLAARSLVGRGPVRAAVAGNPSLPRFFACMMGWDPNAQVRHALVERVDLPGWVLARLELYGRREPQWQYRQLREALARHPHCPPRVHGRLADAERESLRSSPFDKSFADFASSLVQTMVLLPLAVIAAMFSVAGALDIRDYGFAWPDAGGIVGGAVGVVVIFKAWQASQRAKKVRWRVRPWPPVYTFAALGSVAAIAAFVFAVVKLWSPGTAGAVAAATLGGLFRSGPGKSKSKSKKPRRR